MIMLKKIFFFHVSFGYILIHSNEQNEIINFYKSQRYLIGPCTKKALKETKNCNYECTINVIPWSLGIK